MREHQIVITLKPEQFLEVQRLARAANAKSMGIFVRQKLLAALGIEGSIAAPEAASSPDLAAVSADLKRLHSELKMFVAESLSMYGVDPSTAAELVDSMIAVPDVSGVTEAVPEAPPEDFLEQAAEKTFAISPRLGPIGEDIQGRDTAGRDAYAFKTNTQSQSPSPVPVTSSPDSHDDSDSAVLPDEEIAAASFIGTGFLAAASPGLIAPADFMDETIALSDELTAAAAATDVGGPTSMSVTLHETADQELIAAGDAVSSANAAAGITAAGRQASPRIVLDRDHVHSRKDIHRYRQQPAGDTIDGDGEYGGDAADKMSNVKERFEESVVSGGEMRLRRDAVPAEMGNMAAPEYLSGDTNQSLSPASPATSAGGVRDPLDQLIGDDDLAAIKRAAGATTRGARLSTGLNYASDEGDEGEFEEGDDDLFDVPLSIAERRRQLAEQEMAQDANIDEHMSPSANVFDSSQTGSISTNDSAAPAHAENTVIENPPANAAPAPSEAPKPSNDRPLGYPPVSGNPPPKRRQV